MTKKAKTLRKAALVYSKQDQGPEETKTAQIAVVTPRPVGLGFRHYAPDHG